MNRIAQETLVADENVFTFIVLSERLLLSPRIRPCSKERWRHILFSLCHSIVDVEPPSARRGIFRVAAIVFEPNAPNCDPILATPHPSRRQSDVQQNIRDAHQHLLTVLTSYPERGILRPNFSMMLPADLNRR